MRKTTKTGLMVALTVGLAVAILPMCGAKSARMGFSHPRMDNLMMGVGENMVFQVAVHNESDNFLDILMITDNSDTAENGWKNLDGVVRFELITATLKPREIRKITVTFTPPHSGIYEGDILAIPLEDREGSVPMGSAMGCRVHITATEDIENQDNEVTNPTSQSESPPLFILIAGVLLFIGILAHLAWARRKGILKFLGKITMISLLLIVLIAPLAAAESDSMDTDVNVEVPPNPPGAPTLQLPDNGINTNDNTPYFEWTGGSDATSHRIRVDNDSDFSSCEIDNSGLTEDNFTATSELSEDQYWWKVTAVNADGQTDSDVWIFTVDVTPPTAPTLVSPDNGENVADITPTLDWNAVSDNSTPVLYYLAMSDNSDFPYDNENSGWISQTQYTTSILDNGSVWYWRVRAKDNAGNVSENSVARWFRVGVPSYVVTVSITPSTQSGITSENLTYTIRVFNQGASSDNYDLSFTQTMVWSTSLKNNHFENVGAGESRTTTLNVIVGSGGTNTITVTATSQADPAVSDSDSCTAIFSGATPTERSETSIMFGIIAILIVIAIVLPVIGFHWKVIGLVVLGGIAWIMAGVVFFSIELPFSTVPITLLFVGIGIVVFVMVISEALEEFKKSAQGS